MPAIVIAVVAVVGIAACVPVPPPGGSTLVASADASVNSGAHATNYGGDATLRVGGAYRSYLRFDVAGTVSSATLWMRGRNQGDGVNVHQAPCSWTESGLTHANAPAPGALIASVPVRPDEWQNVDVSAQVAGGGAHCFALVATGSAERRFYSRENAASEPRLTLGSSTTTSTSTPPTSTTAPVADPAPNCIGEPADHPVVDYPEPRVFVEAQAGGTTATTTAKSDGSATPNTSTSAPASPCSRRSREPSGWTCG